MLQRVILKTAHDYLIPVTMPTPTLPINKVHRVICHECKPLHATIIQQVLRLLEDDPDTQKSHFFNGRYENIYITKEQIPAIKPILQMILQESAKLLGCQQDDLQLGFWFNFMQKGDVTTPHSHSDNNELLSGTYYLQMPEQSGILTIALNPDSSISITPEEAALTCFHPTVKHQVTQHRAPIPRISIGFNIGYKQNALQD